MQPYFLQKKRSIIRYFLNLFIIIPIKKHFIIKTNKKLRKGER